MTIKRECAKVNCHILIPKDESYCRRHRPKDDRQEAARRFSEPWRWVYRHGKWERTKQQVKARDGWRCTAMEPWGRCTVTEKLTVHHHEPMWLLYRKAGEDKGLLLDMATNKEKLTTLCPKHHREAEIKLRAELRPFRGRMTRHS